MNQKVKYKPGPFSLGSGVVMWTINLLAVLWVIFISIILAFPMVQPVTIENMNYSCAFLSPFVIIYINTLRL
jgi:hypothetical protein